MMFSLENSAQKQQWLKAIAGLEPLLVPRHGEGEGMSLNDCSTFIPI
jgi:hypothetical protein